MKSSEEIFKQMDNLTLGKYFDKEGKPILFSEYSRLFSSPDDYKIIKRDHIENYLISTIWLGFNHGWGEDLQLFETMVFDKSNKENEWEDLYQERCGTKEQALLMHEEAVKWVREKING